MFIHLPFPPPFSHFPGVALQMFSSTIVSGGNVHKLCIIKLHYISLVAGAWTEREKMYHGGSFLKLADDNMDIQNPEAQNRELSGF